ncbi:hypothetical protein [uncultured Gammaproteobacteria bacterium]|nr:hypothetical protein [uncultured Gammaproteobacteria bacterium]
MKELKKILKFFDDVDKGISKIPDQRMRHQLIKQAQYWRSRRLDDFYLKSSEEILDKITKDRSLA